MKDEQQTISYLMDKYKGLIQLEMRFQEWKESNPNKNSWEM